jgi:hypothetical protein
MIHRGGICRGGAGVEFRGHVENGMIRPSEPIDLPNGTEVEIRPLVTTSEAERELIESNRRFWARPSLEDLIREQGIEPIQDLEEFAGVWPSDEDIDDFLKWLREVRL